MRTLNLFALLLFLFAPALSAQERAFMECHYIETFKEDLDKKNKIYQDEMILRVGKNASEFFSLWRRERDLLTDSLRKRGASFTDIMSVREKIKYPISVQYYTIYKNCPQRGVLTHIDNLALQHYLCMESLETPKWEIIPEKKTILDYNCQKATAMFRGRQWNVWFTSEIAVQDGPWKLCGLPGLILQAEDSEQDYTFKCVEIRNVNKTIQIPKRNYVKCSREKFTKEVIEFNENLDAFMKKTGKSAPKAIGDNGKMESAFPQKRFNYIER